MVERDHVTREVNSLEGIVSVKFDLGDRLATVVYDPSVADPDAIVEAIDRANELMRPDGDQADDASRVLG